MKIDDIIEEYGPIGLSPRLGFDSGQLDFLRVKCATEFLGRNVDETFEVISGVLTEIDEDDLARWLAEFRKFIK